jgi:hypothetical protein
LFSLELSPEHAWPRRPLEGTLDFALFAQNARLTRARCTSLAQDVRNNASAGGLQLVLATQTGLEYEIFLTATQISPLSKVVLTTWPICALLPADGKG